MSLFGVVVSASVTVELPDVEHLAHKVQGKVPPKLLSRSCQCWVVRKEVLEARVRVDFSLRAIELQPVC